MSRKASGTIELPSTSTVNAPKLTSKDMERIAALCNCSPSYVGRWYYNHEAVNEYWQKKFTDAMVDVIAEYRPFIAAEIERVDGAIEKLRAVRSGLVQRLEAIPA